MFSVLLCPCAARALPVRCLCVGESRRRCRCRACRRWLGRWGRALAPLTTPPAPPGSVGSQTTAPYSQHTTWGDRRTADRRCQGHTSGAHRRPQAAACTRYRLLGPTTDMTSAGQIAGVTSTEPGLVIQLKTIDSIKLWTNYRK